MSLSLIVRPEAERDILNAARWYENLKLDLGLELLTEIHAAIERALDNPLAYLLLRKHPQVRRVLVRRFPYRVFYIVLPDALVVFAVLHAARGEGRWLQRL
jgi:plasmid stabilization system protein ParE